jgi:hypothetical protein
MHIDYKKPYWIKFQWDLSNHHDNQYVTEFNKVDNDIFKNFLHESQYIITCKFRIKKDYKTDKICMVFGKPGKNMGLSYNTESGVLAFEFWTVNQGEKDDNFHFLAFNYMTREEIENGVTVSIVRDGYKFAIYKDFEKVNIEKFKTNLIDDYKHSGLFIACSNTGTYVPEHRYYGEMDLDYFAVLNNTSDIEEAKDLYQTENEKILNKTYYDDILCLYDFKTINNLGIVYDESKYTHFMELVPEEFILE